MAEGRFAEIVILAEDRLQVRFIRNWLVKHVSHRRIRDSLPEGGSGEQFVRKQFPVEAELHRQNAKKRGSILIAVIDADTGDVAAHYRELIPTYPNRPAEHIFVFVPKRSIETWLHQLNGRLANEEESYKPLYKRDPGVAIRQAGDRFLEFIRSQLEEEDLLPSLALGVQEARCIPKLHDPPIR